MINVLFFGASVTHQSGISGFFEMLSNTCSEISFDRMSFPSSQFYNAGFYNVHKLKKLIKKPDIVFFEWSTTGENEFDSIKLSYFINEMLENNMIPIFLILPKKETYKFNRKNDEQLLFLSKYNNIPVLDLRNLLFEYDADYVLRDGVHTSEFGASLYAKIIKNYLINEFQLSSVNIDYNVQIPQYSINSLDDINLVLNEGQTLAINFDEKFNNSEIAVSLTKRIDTPILEFYNENNLLGKINYFDQWCYYERENFDTFVPNSFFNKIQSNSIYVKISNDSPDYSITKSQKVFDGRKVFNIKSLFYNNLNNFSYEIF